MPPTGWYQHFLTGSGNYSKTAAWVVLNIFLHINDRFSLPDFIKLRRRPAAVLTNTMNMSLTTHRLFPQPSRRIGHHTKQQHPLFQLFAILHSRHIHRYGIHLLRPFTVRIAQRGANLVKLTNLRHRPGNLIPIAKTKRMMMDRHIQAVRMR